MDKTNNLGIKEIAKLANVSIGTIDRVLHNRSGVSPSTKEKVLKIIEETGYRKNIIASRLNLAGRKKIQIAVLLPVIKTDWSYWELPKKGIKKAVKELQEQGISVDYYYFNFLFPKSFTEQYEQILASAYDGVLTVPFLEEESNDLVARAKAKGVPVVFLDTQRKMGQSANFICQNSFNAGMVAGRLLNGLVGKDGRYFVVNILNENGIQINNQQRESGFRAFFEQNFKNYPIDIHTINHPLERKFEISAAIKELFTSPKTKGIFVTNARSFLIPKILGENKITDTFIVGFDINQPNLKLLKKGKIHFLINQKPVRQGYFAIKGLYKYLTERDASELNKDIPVEIIVKENAG